MNTNERRARSWAPQFHQPPGKRTFVGPADVFDELSSQLGAERAHQIMRAYEEAMRAELEPLVGEEVTRQELEPRINRVMDATTDRLNGENRLPPGRLFPYRFGAEISGNVTGALVDVNVNITLTEV